MPSNRHRALAVLGASADGCTETMLSVHGFTPKLIADLIKEGLATVQIETGDGAKEVARVRITDAGRAMLT
jgi:hypothetical protein